MQTVNIHEAKTHLSRIVQQVVATHNPCVIAKAGKPLAKIVPLDTTPSNNKRLGFLEGMGRVPDDFDTMGREAIERMFV